MTVGEHSQSERGSEEESKIENERKTERVSLIDSSPLLSVLCLIKFTFLLFTQSGRIIEIPKYEAGLRSPRHECLFQSTVLRSPRQANCDLRC